jgi:membrane-associated phospholipid phosphatase
VSKKRPGLVGVALRVAAATALGFAARGRLADADEEARKMIASRSSETLDKTLPVLTDLGSTYAVGGAAAVLWAFGKRSLARDVAAAGGIAWVVAQGMKQIYKRARPYDVDEIQILVRKPAGQSYPSGHPAVAAAVTRVLEPNLRQPVRKVVGRIPRMVGFSRVYVGVHYPTDVIGGLLLGRAIGDLWLRYAPRNKRPG